MAARLRSFPLLVILLVVLALALPRAAQADDTDIYIHGAPSGSAEPLVMFSLDYRANLTSTRCADVNAASCGAAAWFRQAGLAADLPASGKLTFFDVLRLSLKLVLAEVEGAKVGLMMSHNESGRCTGYQGETPTANNRCSNGGAILMGFESLSAASRRTFDEKLRALHGLKPTASSPDHPYQGRELFFEFFRYLRGAPVYNAYNGWLDFESGNTGNAGSNMACASPNTALRPACYDPRIVSNGAYRSPLADAAACTSIYTINLMFQVSQQEDDADAAILAPEASGGMAGINLSGANRSFETVVAYLHDRDLAPGLQGRQSVTSYFFVDPTKINTTTAGYASAGGTGMPYALGDDPEQLVRDLRNVFQQILSVSTTFVSASVPVNVFNRASMVDNVYIALFQAQAEPWWPGNLKKLKLHERRLADGTTKLQLIDARGQPAVAADGRIHFDALTHWTDGGALLDADEGEAISRGSDGRHVARGGAGQKIPGFLRGLARAGNGEPGARQLWFESGGVLRPLDADAATRTLLRPLLGPARTDAQLDRVLRYIRGFRDEPGAATDAVRGWLLGDVLHSRPLPVNYGDRIAGYSRDNPAIFIAAGSNDGFLRLIRNTAPDGAESGEEIWAFMPQETMAMQARLAANQAGEPRHPYGVDGTPVSFTDPASGRTLLYFGLRRGGSAYYALDVTAPASPSFAWKITPATPGFAELGLTFSTPQAGFVRPGPGPRIPALFFGGGYDAGKDYRVPNGPDSRGRALYVVNALTGQLIWSAAHGAATGSVAPGLFTHRELADSVSSDLTVLDTDGDGLVDRIVTGDTGGNLWRADLLAGDVGRWQLSLLARLGYHANATEPADLRFFHAPDVVQSRDAEGPFDAVIAGSGDRENPLDRFRAHKPVNAVFLVKDRATRVHDGVTTRITDLARQPSDLTDVTGSECLVRKSARECGIDIGKGWRVHFAGAGEKALASPVTAGRVIYLTTYRPGEGREALTCGPAEGGGALYALALEDGAAAFNYNRSDDSAGDTSGRPNSLDDRADELASAGIPSEVVFIPGGEGGMSFIRPDLEIERPPTSNRFRTFWQRVEH